MIRQIRDVEGSHLTAADRRNLVALIFDHPSFAFGTTYKVNGRKRYKVDPDGARYRVTITETTCDNWQGERRDRVSRATFRVVAR